MAAEWRSSTIGDLCDQGVIELQTGPFGSQLHAHDYVESGISVVPTEAIRDRRIDHALLPKVTPGKAAELARHRLEVGDILFARRGVQATGHIGYVRNGEGGFLCGTGAIRLRVRRPDDTVDSDFLSHVFANPQSIGWFKFHAIGATMPNLNEGIIRSFPLQIPPLAEQRAIAHILGTLDDKIELNRRMSDTLEAMARALFKSWFVDFDPVRAKVEGRDPGLPESLAGLFPDSFEHSVLGEIPSGWRLGRIDDVLAELVSGARPTGGAVDEGVPSIGAENVIGLGRYDFSKEKFVPREFFEQLKAKGAALRAGDVLLYKDGAQIGRKTFVDADFPHAECAINEHVFILRARRREEQRFLFFWLDQPWMTHEIISLNSNSAQPGINQPGVRGLPLLIPGTAAIDAFDALSAPLTTRLLANCKESRTLAAKRDALLPKLTSGELRVNNSRRETARGA